ncbi:MAG: hypothetical protein ACI8UO_000956 [Verrucomicrobiales bacterium]|jgi:hypothetical protein
MAASRLPAAADENPLAGEVGIVAAVFGSHQKKGALKLNDIPKVARDELDMRVVDMNTMNFTSLEPAVVDPFREAAESAGCVLTNLKMNQRGIDPGSADPEARKHAVEVYKKSIDAAARMGMRWARPLPTPEKPEMSLLVESFRELADYGGEKEVEILVENFGWMQADPNSVVSLIEAVDRDLPASPDTGNWNSNEIRYPGLEKTFPLAATCDFKAKTLGADGQHAAYDLERCFEIGWKAGFRGPWCIEHGHADFQQLLKNIGSVGDQLRAWIKDATA